MSCIEQAMNKAMNKAISGIGCLLCRWGGKKSMKEV